MDKELVTIIIPTFNSEKFLPTLISSLKNQVYKNFNVIFIDDNSKDNTLMLLNEYKQSDDIGIDIISLTENHGVSYCRNIGIKKAATKYITFLDSDDWIDISTLDNCLFFIKQDIDVINYGLCFDYFNTNVSQKHYSYPKRILTTGEYALKIYGHTLHDEINIAPNVYNKLYKLSFLKENDILFDENTRYQEDDVFTFIVLMMAQSVAFVPSSYYHYFQNLDSAIHTVSDVSIKHFVTAYKGLSNYLKNKNKFEHYRDEFYLRFKTSLKGVMQRTIEYGKSTDAICRLLALLYKLLAENFDLQEILEYCNLTKLQNL